MQTRFRMWRVALTMSPPVSPKSRATPKMPEQTSKLVLQSPYRMRRRCRLASLISEIVSACITSFLMKFKRASYPHHKRGLVRHCLERVDLAERIALLSRRYFSIDSNSDSSGAPAGPTPRFKYCCTARPCAFDWLCLVRYQARRS